VAPNPFIFLPFNAGPRICLGQQVRVYIPPLLLVRLLQKYSGISLVMDAQPPLSRPPENWSAQDDPLRWKAREKLSVKNHLTAYPEDGLWVNMKEAS
ncbi:hypothetical protein C8J57DRAFT_988641, partial [Mycena rebaudengoi]